MVYIEKGYWKWHNYYETIFNISIIIIVLVLDHSLVAIKEWTNYQPSASSGSFTAFYSFNNKIVN